jgi:murein DD-endopeptidase MepM/ murein hydrolase activator NlpD
MKHFVTIAFIFFAFICKAEHKVKVYFENTENGYNIFADNAEFCPMSLKVDFTVNNLEIDGGNNTIYLLNAKTKKQLLTTLTRVSKKGNYKMSFNYFTNYGDHNKSSYEQDYAYHLPYSTQKKFEVFQGYDGPFSHQNENALDFSMAIGTEITAVRDGVVVNIVDVNSETCNNRECIKFNNFILIYHNDGTFAEYAHIKQNGAAVKIGDVIKKDQLIAYSGNVGYSSGPHLHLVIFKQKLNERETLKTKFKIGDGNTIAFLKEKKEYLRVY